MPAAPSPPEIPGYDYVRLLGSGGSSDVFLFEQREPRRSVAVKVLRAAAASPAERAAFSAEANVMSELSPHPAIVLVYETGEASDGRPYYVMEYLAGPSLAELARATTFSIAYVLGTGVRLSNAVSAAHAAGILHRDIKPANVLTDGDRRVALTDFGIASAIGEDTLPITTTTLAGLGVGGAQPTLMSVPWSPPEMFVEEPHPDARSDVYSLAATIYTLLAGRSPFERSDSSNGTDDLIGRITRGEVTPAGRADAPLSLLAALRTGMSVEPRDRFDSAASLGAALQAVERELGLPPSAVEPGSA
jgi:serine/threonine protein kinase